MLLLETGSAKVLLTDNTLVFALDDTGNENLIQEGYPVFGLGGCAFMVGDYERLVQKPFIDMLSR